MQVYLPEMSITLKDPKTQMTQTHTKTDHSILQKYVAGGGILVGLLQPFAVLTQTSVVFHGHPLGHYYCAHGNVHKEYSHHKSE
jgi:hypothetical protein